MTAPPRLATVIHTTKLVRFTHVPQYDSHTTPGEARWLEAIQNLNTNDSSRLHLLSVRPHAAKRVLMSVNVIEWALRVILAVACVIHSLLDVCFTGAKSHLLNVEDSIPRWLLPAVGVLRAVACVALLSSDDLLVLGALAYCSMLWCGAVYFHVRREHHPAAVVPAGFFVVWVFAIAAMQVGFLMALVGQVACALAAVALGWMLVTPPGGAHAMVEKQRILQQLRNKSSLGYSPPQPSCCGGAAAVEGTPSTTEALL